VAALLNFTAEGEAMELDYFYLLSGHYPQTEAELRNYRKIHLIALVVVLVVSLPIAFAAGVFKSQHHSSHRDSVINIDSAPDELP
jgi:hypothetical protein